MNKKHNHNIVAVKKLAEKYGVTYRFVTMSIVGDRNSYTAIKIAEEYKRVMMPFNKTLSEL